jgi:hypothetical protein
MAQFILNYTGEGPKPSPDVEKFRRLPNTTILDESLPHMILIEGPSEVVEAASRSIDSWSISPTRVYRSPGRHPLIDRHLG